MAETNGNGPARLLTDIKESLEREIHDFRSEMRTRFDDQAARMDRQAGILRAGTTWTKRMDDWAEKVDRALDAKDRQIAELTERIRRLEGKN
jgi:hypothetical protein